MSAGSKLKHVTFPSDLASIVNDLAVAQKKIAYYEEILGKMDAAQAEVDSLRARLLAILNERGFTEEAVALLLAAR